MNNTPTISIPEEVKQQLENEIAQALLQRARIGKHSGWDAAIKWFAKWQAEKNKKNSLQS
jgi:hypothetical protein